MPRIELTKDQFKNLLELVYLGELLAVGPETSQKDVDRYEQTVQLIQSFSEEENLREYVEWKAEIVTRWTSQSAREIVERAASEFNEQVIIDGLIDQLSYRDALQGGQDEKDVKFFLRFKDVMDSYYEEFERDGIANMVWKAPKRHG